MAGLTDADDFRKQLVGVWRLVSYESYGSNRKSDVLRPFGSEPEGLILYTHDGFLSVQIMRTDRPYIGGPHNAGGDDLVVAAASGFIGYSGRFTVLDGRTVVHHISVSLVPDWIGTSQYRHCQLAGSRLELSLTEPILFDGELRNVSLVWERA
jgi:Lipocalin-like domain